jgi:hypothetical protein
MKFYGIDSNGVLQIPRVATLPTYDYTLYKGAIYYQESDTSFYIGIGDSGGNWVKIVDEDGLDIQASIIAHNSSSGSHTVAIGVHNSSGTAHQDIRDLVQAGTSGTSGISGTSGTSGISGTSGTSGATGSTGTSGTSGSSGVSGSSGLTPYLLVADTTYYLSPTGSDSTGDGSVGNPWFSLNKAFEYLADRIIAADAQITIQLANGTYQYSTAQVCNHVNGKQIRIIGQNSYSLTMSAIVTGYSASINTSNVVTAVITVNDASNITASASVTSGDYVLIKNCFITPGDPDDFIGRSNPLLLNGIFKVTAKVGNNITVQSTMRGGIYGSTFYSSLTIPTGSYQASVTVLKSVILTTSDNAGILVRGGFTLGDIATNYFGIDKLAIVAQTYTSNTDTDMNEDLNAYLGPIGIASEKGSVLLIGGDVGVSNFRTGIWSVQNSHIKSCGACVCGGEFGFMSGHASSMICFSSYVAGCGYSMCSFHTGSIFCLDCVSIFGCYTFSAQHNATGWFDDCASYMSSVGVLSSLSSIVETPGTFVYNSNISALADSTANLRFFYVYVRYATTVLRADNLATLNVTSLDVANYNVLKSPSSNPGNNGSYIFGP